MIKKILFAIFSIILFFNGKSQEVKWYTIEEAMELTKKEPRIILIDVYTDWCKYCKIMDANTFNNKVIAEFMNQKYYPVKFNAEQKQEITVGGQTFKFVAQGARGYHELAAALLNGKMGYPSVVFLNGENNKLSVLQMLQGYYQAKDFDAIIKFIGNEHYKTGSWEDFVASYKSPITE